MPQLFDWGLHKLYSDIKPFGKRGEQQIIRYPDITIYPEGVFIPFRYAETFTPECVKENTYTIHWWNASWVKDDVLFFLENKHKYTDTKFCTLTQWVHVLLKSIPKSLRILQT